MKKIATTLLIAGMTTMTGCASLYDSAQGNTHQSPATSLNGVLVDKNNHMTLYTFDNDTINQSNCKGMCQTNWPPFYAPSTQANATGKYTTIKREDGQYQWALDGKPLYFFAQDTQSGDKKGDNVKNIWHIISAK